MIKPSPSGRYFTDEWGKPVFWLGDTQWEMFRLYTPEGASPILKDRQAKGFNAILVMLMGVDMTRFGHKAAVPYANLGGERPWLDDDPEEPNEKYFRHIDPIIRPGALTGAKQVTATWIDPATGERTDAGSFPANAAQSFTTPREWGDSILHLKGE